MSRSRRTETPGSQLDIDEAAARPCGAGARWGICIAGLDTLPAEAHVITMLQLPSSNLPIRSLLAAATAAIFLISGITMAQECPLTAPLVLKDLQSGFVGQTGTVWTITPDCRFTIARQIGAKVGDPYKQGRLTPEQRQRLASLIARMDLTGFPDRLGDAPQPNARQITVSYGKAVSVLTLPPGGNSGALSAAGGDQRTAQLLELAHALSAMIGG
jgi:hypothetical protein